MIDLDGRSIPGGFTFFSHLPPLLMISQIDLSGKDMTAPCTGPTPTQLVAYLVRWCVHRAEYAAEVDTFVDGSL